MTNHRTPEEMNQRVIMLGVDQRWFVMNLIAGMAVMFSSRSFIATGIACAALHIVAFFCTGKDPVAPLHFWKALREPGYLELGQEE